MNQPTPSTAVHPLAHAHPYIPQLTLQLLEGPSNTSLLPRQPLLQPRFLPQKETPISSSRWPPVWTFVMFASCWFFTSCRFIAFPTCLRLGPAMRSVRATETQRVHSGAKDSLLTTRLPGPLLPWPGRCGNVHGYGGVRELSHNPVSVYCNEGTGLRRQTLITHTFYDTRGKT